ncbi:hypothetical protein ACOSQ3_022381 [Xanthoceras sorbifolium]
MAFVGLFKVFLAVICFFILHYFAKNNNKNGFPKNFPLVGCLSVEFPQVLFSRALEDAEKSIFYSHLVSKNPKVETRIREELSIIPYGKSRKWWEFDLKELHKLAYLHGAICEALRLYPPLPFQHKAPAKPDILPSEHWVVPSTKILFSLSPSNALKGYGCSEQPPKMEDSILPKPYHTLENVPFLLNNDPPPY